MRQYEVAHVYFCVMQRGAGRLSHFHPEFDLKNIVSQGRNQILLSIWLDILW